jgi:hypothetical protein
MKNQKRIIGLLIVILVFILLTGCAKKEIVDECLTGHTYNFWGGLWHGIIAPIDFIGMLLHKDVTIYAQNNNGNWYAFGFLLGSGGWGLVGGRGIFGRKHSRRSRE